MPDRFEKSDELTRLNAMLKLAQQLEAKIKNHIKKIETLPEESSIFWTAEYLAAHPELETYLYNNHPNFYRESRRLIEKLYAQTDSLFIRRSTHDEEQSKEQSPITVKSEGETVYIRMPMLPGTIYTGFKIAEKQADGHYHSGLYAQSLRKEMERLVFTEPDFPRWRGPKTLMYLFVYNTPQNNVPYIKDSDNHDTKKISDAVTKFYGGDSGQCRVIYDTIGTDDICEGTYITLQPYTYNIPDAEKIIDFWKV